MLHLDLTWQRWGKKEWGYWRLVCRMGLTLWSSRLWGSWTWSSRALSVDWFLVAFQQILMAPSAGPANHSSKKLSPSGKNNSNLEIIVKYIIMLSNITTWPWSTMVTIVQQPNENEQRRRKQTIERAKANHVVCLPFQPSSSLANHPLTSCRGNYKWDCSTPELKWNTAGYVVTLIS